MMEINLRIIPKKYISISTGDMLETVICRVRLKAGANSIVFGLETEKEENCDVLADSLDVLFNKILSTAIDDKNYVKQIFLKGRHRLIPRPFYHISSRDRLEPGKHHAIIYYFRKIQSPIKILEDVLLIYIYQAELYTNGGYAQYIVPKRFLLSITIKPYDPVPLEIEEFYVDIDNPDPTSKELAVIDKIDRILKEKPETRVSVVDRI